MLKKITLLVLSIFMIFSLAGCNSSKAQEAELKEEIQSLKKEIYEKREEIKELNTQISDLQEDKDNLISKDDISYVLTLQITQSHVSIDPTMWIKDAINEIELPIPVSKSYYYSVEVGDVLNGDFRWGSFLMEGSIGNWNITVKEKTILNKNTN